MGERKRQFNAVQNAPEAAVQELIADIAKRVNFAFNARIGAGGAMVLPVPGTEQVGYLLMVYPMHGAERSNYVSNSPRELTIRMLREQADYLEATQDAVGSA